MLLIVTSKVVPEVSYTALNAVTGVKKVSPYLSCFIDEFSQSDLLGRVGSAVSKDIATTSPLLYKPKECLAAAFSSSVLNSLKKFS
jgi:hypothetical protein